MRTVVRILFFPTSERKIPLEEQEVDAAKNVVCSNQHILLFAKMQIRFCPQGASFHPELSGYKTALRPGNYECRASPKIRHEYPVTFHAAKLR